MGSRSSGMPLRPDGAGTGTVADVFAELGARGRPPTTEGPRFLDEEGTSVATGGSTTEEDVLGITGGGSRADAVIDVVDDGEDEVDDGTTRNERDRTTSAVAMSTITKLL